jgi:cytochrome c peroxidase
MKTVSIIFTALLSAFGVIAWVVPRAASTSAPRESVETPARQGGPAETTAPRLDESHPILPIPRQAQLDERVVALGRKLFHDPLLSADGTISCASCHDLNQGGADGRRVSIGIGGAQGERNAPTVLNSSLNFTQFWDGREKTLEDQVGGPLANPIEMGSNWPDVLGKLRAVPEYVHEFAAVYPAGISVDSVKNAIATFERALVTPDSRFDRYLRGDREAINADELRGYELFKEVGCITCHQGANVGGNLFQRFGIASNFFADRGGMRTSDLGRFNLTGKESDRFKFKVPTLRNITMTGPYLHDGSAATLEQAIRIMAQYQLGMSLAEQDVASIAAFLSTLEGRTEE